MAKRSTPAAAQAATPATPVVKGGIVKTVALSAAIKHNRELLANADAPAPVELYKAAKGENPKRVRVYGYDNGEGGMGIPKFARVLGAPGFTGTPKGVAAAQWELLAGLLGGTVTEAKDAGVTARTLRRSYRAGAIRFVLL